MMKPSDVNFALSSKYYWMIHNMPIDGGKIYTGIIEEVNTKLRPVSLALEVAMKTVLYKMDSKP